MDLSKHILNGDSNAKIKAIKDLNPFSKIGNLGSKISVSSDAKGIIDVIIHVHGDEIVPDESKSLLKAANYL